MVLLILEIYDIAVVIKSKTADGDGVGVSVKVAEWKKWKVGEADIVGNKAHFGSGKERVGIATVLSTRSTNNASWVCWRCPNCSSWYHRSGRRAAFLTKAKQSSGYG